MEISDLFLSQGIRGKVRSNVYANPLTSQRRSFEITSVRIFNAVETEFVSIYIIPLLRPCIRRKARAWSVTEVIAQPVLTIFSIMRCGVADGAENHSL